MNSELEEQQKLTFELKEKLSTLEEEEKTITGQIQVLEAKWAVQQLRDKVKVKSGVISQLRAKKEELEKKLKLGVSTTTEEQVKLPPEQEPPRRVF